MGFAWLRDGCELAGDALARSGEVFNTRRRHHDQHVFVMAIP